MIAEETPSATELMVWCYYRCLRLREAI